jgi:Ca2+-transporting ATPase
LVVFAEKLYGKPECTDSAFKFNKEIGEKVTKIATLDFTSERKSMSTIVRGYKNAKDTLMKGAPDRVIAKCTHFSGLAGVKEMTDSDRKALLSQVGEMASKGLRCLAIAEIPNAGKLSGLTEENKAEMLMETSKYGEFEQSAVFLGVVCIKDPVRDGIEQCMKECHTAGIKVIMITGDSKETATAIAQEIGIIPSQADPAPYVFTGDQFHSMTEAQRRSALIGDSGKVFSRVEPGHKRELVKCLIEMGEIVAMTGDGVNDAPALKQAHIGIAMGITGTEVAKSASDMVLADDNFLTIVKAVEEGRSIYSNMKAFIRYLISSNIGEVLSIFFTALLGIPEGFTSVQLLWVNLVTDGPPATALGFNPPDLDIMKKPPRKQDDNLISGWVLVRYVVIGVYVGLATVGVFIYWYLFAETGDNHSLVSWDQLSSWTTCS